MYTYYCFDENYENGIKCWNEKMQIFKKYCYV